MVRLESKRELKKLEGLKKNIERLERLDKTISDSEKKLLDSINIIKQDLINYKANQAKENLKLRKQNEKLQNLFNSIDLSDRPDF